MVARGFILLVGVLLMADMHEALAQGYPSSEPQQYSYAGSPGQVQEGVIGRPRILLSSRAMQCVDPAASYHRVNPDILKAIARVESRGDGRTVTRNSNNSMDVGLVGTNSIHFPELIKKGVAPQDLLDECVALYVGAWMYSKKIARHGNTWRAIGAYHSETPRFNYRYQVMIYNELVSMRILPGPKKQVPPLR